MAMRVGIACDLEVRKWQLEKLFKNTRGWRRTKAFESKKEAMLWEENACEHFSCKPVERGENPKNPKMKWHGFVFEHDGPK